MVMKGMLLFMWGFIHTPHSLRLVYSESSGHADFFSQNMSDSSNAHKIHHPSSHNMPSQQTQQTGAHVPGVPVSDPGLYLAKCTL